MINAADVPAERFRTSTQLIRDRALVRGWKVWVYYVGSSHLRVERADGKILELHSATPSTTTLAAGLRANDKYFAHVALEAEGLPLAETYLVDSPDMLMPYGQRILAKGKGVVVKPLDAAHGHGITVDVQSEQGLQEAAAHALQYSDNILLQAFVTQAVDIRLLCIGYKFVAALVRVPARVQGDGVHTVAELIAIENASGRRGEAYAKPLNVINPERAANYLGDNMQAVPSVGEWVQVLGTANVGTGGEAIDVTNDVPAWLVAMAERTSRIMQLPVCGTDFLLTQMPQPTASQIDLSPIIIEVNACPSLSIHELPVHGKAQPVTDAYLDYLESL